MWVTPKLDWLLAALSRTDMNRIEGDELHLYTFVEDIIAIRESVESNDDDIVELVTKYFNYSGFDIGYVDASMDGYVTKSHDTHFVAIMKFTTPLAPYSRIMIEGQRYFMYDSNGAPVLANTIEASDTDPVYILVLFLEGAAIILYNNFSYSKLTTYAHINGQDLVSDKTAAQLNISGENMPYNANKTVTKAITDLIAPPVGQIVTTALYMDSRFILADGSMLDTTDYAELFAAIGYAYGGSGASFRLPNNNAIIHHSYIRAFEEEQP